MKIRVDLECVRGHRKNDVTLEAPKKGPIKYPRCTWAEEKDHNGNRCNEEVYQVYDKREDTEGYWVFNGANW